MAITKMKKLRLLALRSQRGDLLRELMLLGCVEVAEPQSLPEDSELAAVLRREVSSVDNCRLYHSEALRALEVLDKYAPVKTKVFAAKPEVSASDLLEDATINEQLSLAQEINLLDAKLRRLSVKEGRRRSFLESLQPWESLDIPLETTGTRLTSVAMGAVPSSVEFDTLKAELAETCEEAELELVSSDLDQHRVVCIYIATAQQEVMELLRSFGFAAAAFGEVDGTARENIAASQQKLDDYAAQKEALVSQLQTYAEKRFDIKLCADRATSIIDRAQAQGKLVGTESVIMLEGWLSVPEEAGLAETLKKYDCAWETWEPVKDEYPDVPVQLRNNKLTWSMSMITEMYSLPAYGSVDPNPLMMPFFVLFYGMMLADVGYGLLMIIAGLILSRKVKTGMLGYMFNLAVLCGITTTLWGAVTGGFLGDFIPQIVSLINPGTTIESFWSLTPFGDIFPLFTPLDDTLMILIGSLALGFVHLMCGTVIGFIRKMKAGDVFSGIFEEGTWWVIFAGIACMVFGAASVGGVPIVLCVGGVMLFIGSARGKKGFGIITGFFGAVYNGVTGYFGDILSYSRLMALMLAGSVIAQVFNTLGAMTGNIVTFILIALVGNALNFALNLLGCFVHDMRLQCLEYFGKFYDDGGRAFKPLKINSKYVNTVK